MGPTFPQQQTFLSTESSPGRWLDTGLLGVGQGDPAVVWGSLSLAGKTGGVGEVVQELGRSHREGPTAQ